MEELIAELNTLLADLNVYYRKLQNFHWNVQGKDFFVIHAKLEEYYEEVNEQIDEVAEHILTLNGEPLGTLKDYIETTQLEEAQNEKVKGEEIFQEVIKDLNTLQKETTSIKEKADSLKSYTTSSIVDNYMIDYGKKLWMLNQMHI